LKTPALAVNPYEYELHGVDRFLKINKLKNSSISWPFSQKNSKIIIALLQTLFSTEVRE
jgi:hypothetical protein